MIKKYAGIIITILMCMAVYAAPLHAEELLRAAVIPDHIVIDAFYDGSSVSITGTLPSDCDAVVRMTGETVNLRMKKKGKVFGILWMNLDTLTFEAVPSVFMLNSAKKIEELAETRKKDAPVWQIGLTSLSDRIIVKPERADRNDLVSELLKLKEHEGLYSGSRDIRYTPAKEDKKRFETDFKIPPKLPPGNYKIEAFAIRHGDIAAQYEHPLTVKLEGFPKILSELAFQHSAMYGVLATLIAVVAGLLTGVIFGSGKGGH
jgi:uncharacterized protein (TIGR02186 family)